MGGVGAEESPTVGTYLFDRDHRGDRTHDDGLLLDLAVIGCPHRTGLQRGSLHGALEGHRHALLHEKDAPQETHRHEHVDHHAPHIDEEVADGLLAAEQPNDRGQRAEAHSGRDEHVRDDKEDLAEVGEMHVARVVLQVGVGHEGGDRIEDGGRPQHAEPARVQRR